MSVELPFVRRSMPGHYQTAFEIIRVLSFGTILLGHVAKIFLGRFTAGGWGARFLETIHDWGTGGTMAFFALASFYLCRTLMLGEKPWPALSRRLKRIYPPFLIMLFLYLALMLLFPPASKLPHSGWAQALYVVSNVLMLPSLLQSQSVLAVTWAVGSVVYANVAIAFAYDALGIRLWRRKRRMELWVGIWLALQAATVFMGDTVAFQVFRLSGFALGALAVELWYPVGVWNSRAVPANEWGSRLARFVEALRTGWFGRHLAAWLTRPGVQQAGRALGRRAYYTLLTHGLALHAVRVYYPWQHPIGGSAPGFADLVAIVALVVALALVLGELLAELERVLVKRTLQAWQFVRHAAHTEDQPQTVTLG
jgi:peptidoglycan/LPS O-acetylase OafA/YrhL